MNLEKGVKITQIIAGIISIPGLYFTFRQIPPFRYWDPLFGNGMYKLHNQTNVSFDDIIGFDDVKLQLKIHIQKMLKGIDADILPRGYQFLGPNGVGKTMMAKAIAQEFDIPFIEICVEEISNNDIIPLIDKIINKYPKCIIFIDESDKNTWFNNKGSSILKKIDGMTNVKGVLFIITGNENSQDISLNRSGRIDNMMHFEAPNKKLRLEFIQKIFKNLCQEDQELLSLETESLVYADLIRMKRECVFYDNNENLDNIRKIIKKIKEKNNNEISEKIDNKYLERIAYHELGHFIVAECLDEASHMQFITIKEGKDYAGYCTSNKPNYVLTKCEILGQIAVNLGSSISEEYFCGSSSTLVQKDFQNINSLINILIVNNMLISSQFKTYQYKIDKPNLNKEIDELIATISSIVKIIIEENKENIESIKKILMEEKTIYRSDFGHLIQENIKKWSLDQCFNKKMDL